MRRLSFVLLAALAVAGCKKKEAGPAPVVAAAPGSPEAAQTTIKGKVLERIDAPPYSYLRLQTAQGETWAAVPKTDAANGAEIVVTGAMPMTGFESKTLQRKFDVIYFGALPGEGGGAQAAAAPAAMPGAGMPGAGMPGAGMPGAAAGEAPSPAGMAAQHAAAAAGPADVGNVKVPKATGADARTVAEVHAQRSSLKDKPVTIRGKIVKYNEGIMGRNWLHIRDGSGSAGKDNDLTVTTAEKAAVGDVVLVKGKVQIDRDFGAGYSYPVIVEDAKLSAK